MHPIGARIEISFQLAPPSPPPYRISNLTNYVFTCYQKGLERSVHRVGLKAEEPFAWAESSLEHILVASLYRVQTDLVLLDDRGAVLEQPSAERRAILPRRTPSGSFNRGARERGWRDTQLQPLAQAQQIKLDALSQPLQLGSPAVAWARVDLGEDGVRVLTITEERTEPPSTAAAEEPHLFLGLYVESVGISLVHAAFEELLYVSARQFTIDYVQSERTATFAAHLISFQVDNQQASATLPAVISLSDVTRNSGEPVFHITAVKDLRRVGGAVEWWENVSCRLLELDVALEPSLLQSMLDLVIASKLPHLALFIRDAFPRSGEEESKRAASIRAARSELLRYGAPQRMWYFQKLELHPVKLNLTFRGSEGRAAGGDSVGPTLFLPIPNIDAAAICLASLVRENLFFDNVDELGSAIGLHYLYAVLRQVTTPPHATTHRHTPPHTTA